MEGLERIKILASEVTNKPLLKVVDYLLTRNDMNEKYLNEEKSLKQMISFIRKEAEKEQEDGMAMIEDVVVYGWAIHYFDESNEKLGLVKKEVKEEKNETISNIEAKKIETKEDKVQLHPKTKGKNWIPEGQLSLF